uniref:Uncharacterized protein n=1 Tax=uncultured prokaryote TaxID=198431 RepID=A0A0H5QN47_9ZZZZ|nr:hypothetical protein [uncultured prokaryote]
MRWELVVALDVALIAQVAGLSWAVVSTYRELQRLSEWQRQEEERCRSGGLGGEKPTH